MKKVAAAVALTLLLAMVALNIAYAAPSLDSPWFDPSLRTRVEPALLKQLLAAGPGDHIPMIVVMQEQVAPGAQGNVVASLQSTADRSQAGVRGFLAAEQMAGRAEAVRTFWIFNGLALRGAPQTAEALARRDDVALIRLDRYEKRLAPQEVAQGNVTSAGLAWGVKQVRADLVWQAFGDTGSGVVVANMDTGVDFLHPALNSNYRGNVGKNLYQHAGNWFDATDEAAAYPLDGFGHGTHVMGTLAGQDGIGVAPGARWIAVRVLNNQGMGYDSWIHAGFEWILAPGGDPNLRPQVVNNSWGSTRSDSTEFQGDLARLSEAGIVVVFSAGNAGPDAGTIGSPASLPGVMAVGALDADDETPEFSSRGPTPWHEVKPILAAPGVNVLSALPGGVYGVESGTSMAAPHVAGIAALMLSANPSLTITATRYALTSTAINLGRSVPNNDSGWGRVDAYAAVQASAGAGIVEGVVMAEESGLPVPGAQVTLARHGAVSGLTIGADASGNFRAALGAGPYRVTAAQFGYEPDSADPVMVITGTTTSHDFFLKSLPVGGLSGGLTDAATGHAVTATISVLGTPVKQELAVGRYSLNLPPGSYTVEARSLGYRVITDTVTITAGQLTQQNFRLAAAPRILLVNSGAWYYGEQPGYFREALDGLSYTYDERRIKHPWTDTPVITDMLKYDLVIWSSPQDSPGLIDASTTVSRYLKKGGHLILTGQDVAFWDSGAAPLLTSTYLRDLLKTNFVADDAGTRVVNGAAGDIMAGQALRIAGGSGANNQLYPDEISLTDDDYGAGILRYDTGGVAGTRVGLCLPYRAVFLGFGFEAISSAAARQAVMSRAIDYLFSPPPAQGFSLKSVDATTQVGQPGTVVTFTLRARNGGQGGGPVTYQAALESASWGAIITPTQFTLAPCASTQLTITTRIPAGAAVDARNLFTLNIASEGKIMPGASITLLAKAPAPVLLVDHHRWYDVQSLYTRALQAAGIAYDVWTLPSSGRGPSARQLSWYPLTIWFTGYDWYQPLATYDETQLAAYLDGGGRLMLSSVFYLGDQGLSSFARDRLGVLSFTTGITATQASGAADHPVGVGFGSIPLVDPFPRSGFFTLDAAIAPSAAANTAWRGDHSRAVAIAKADTRSRVVFWTIPFEALAEEMRAPVLARTLGWLGPLGRSTVSVEPAVALPGQPVSVRLDLRNDLVPTRASIRVELPTGARPDLASIPASWAYDPATQTLRGEDESSPGTPLQVTFRLETAGLGPGRLSGKVIFRDERLGIDFEQPLQLAIATPDLGASSLHVAPARSGQPGLVTMVVRNDGIAPATAARVTALIPLDARVVAGTATLAGPGTLEVMPPGLRWTGPLAAGESATITYQVRVPPSAEKLTLPLEMLAEDGSAGSWAWRSWLLMEPNTAYLPKVGR